jgi:hypothetical protein
VTVLLEASEELVEQDHLSGVHDDTLELLVTVRRALFGAVEEVRVVRSLLELHGDIEQVDLLVGAGESGVVLLRA